MPHLDYDENTVKKFLEFARYGFVKGKGKPEPGECCIEVALCYALGYTKINDQPECVDSEVIEFKISLNDCNWNDNLTRAKWMAPLGIAQLGSKNVVKGFKARFKELEKEEIIIPSFDWIPEDKRVPEHEELKEFLKKENDNKKLKEKFKNYYYYNYYYYYYYYNYNYYYYYDNYYYNYNDFLQKILIASTQLGLKVLKELKSPGCKYLYLLDDWKVEEASKSEASEQ